VEVDDGRGPGPRAAHVQLVTADVELALDDGRPASEEPVSVEGLSPAWGLDPASFRPAWPEQATPNRRTAATTLVKPIPALIPLMSPSIIRPVPRGMNLARRRGDETSSPAARESIIATPPRQDVTRCRSPRTAATRNDRDDCPSLSGRTSFAMPALCIFGESAITRELGSSDSSQQGKHLKGTSQPRTPLRIESCEGERTRGRGPAARETASSGRELDPAGFVEVVHVGAVALREHTER
jgi:hypothetical protein